MIRISAMTSVLACAMSMAIWNATASAQSTTGPAPANRATPQTDQQSTQATKATSEYVQKAAMGDLFEIQSSELALKQAENTAVKAFAQRMVNDHATTSKTLKAAIQSANVQVQPPDKLDKAHEAKLNELRKLKGSQFDNAYMREQIDAHTEALQLHRTYAEKGDNPVLKKTAANTATIVEEHLREAQDIAKNMTPQSSSTGGGSR